VDGKPFGISFSRLYAWFKSQHWGQKSISDRYALLEACLIGIFSALAALLLKEGVGWLGGNRLRLVNQWGTFPVLPLFGLILGALAGLLVEYSSPSAKGGGIAQVKAALARFPVPLSLRVAVVKIIGTIFVLGAGLTLGRRAPTVHIGAALAAELTRWVPTSPEHRRRMIAAGAAAGLAAGFNTPIAGVLFVVEELMRDVSNLTLETAIIASFTGSVVSLILQSSNLQLPQSVIEFDHLSFNPAEIPFYLILGIIAGILGALFNQSVLFSFRFNQKLKLPLFLRIGIAGLISGLIVACLPPLFLNNAGLREFLVRGELGWREMALVFLAHYLLTIIAAGSGAPGGLFAPALIMGSALGYLMGDIEGLITGTGSSPTFALAGMGALFTGIVRVPVTAIVMVFELNANFNLVLPLMISCAVAYMSAETLQKGSLDEHLLRDMGMELEEEVTNAGGNSHFLHQLTASEVMQSQVETVSPDLTIAELLELMSLSHHRGFPVVEKGRLVGIVTQSDLAKVKGNNPHTTIGEFMTNKPVTIAADASLSNVLYLLNRYQLSRLPVIEQQKLVGIITRTDIIRAEVSELQVDTPIRRPEESYTVYQTRSPAVGRGVLLVPLELDDDYERLFTIAQAIASYYSYEIEFVQIIKVAQYQDPRTTPIDTTKARHLMHHLQRKGRKANLSLHTSIIVAHHRSGVLLDLIKQKYINILLMGWKQSHHSPEFIFSHLIDNLINRATCELILVKLGKHQQSYPQNELGTGSCLVPMAGGPNALEGLKLLPAFLEVYSADRLPPVWLAKVHHPSNREIDCHDLDVAVDQLKNSLKTSVNPLCIRSYSVVKAIVNVAKMEKCRLVILGASRESLLQQAISGNIPEAIASKLDTTVILIRLPSS
jgi:CIC family chloride channel protein